MYRNDLRKLLECFIFRQYACIPWLHSLFSLHTRHFQRISWRYIIRPSRRTSIVSKQTNQVEWFMCKIPFNNNFNPTNSTSDDYNSLKIHIINGYGKLTGLFGQYKVQYFSIVIIIQNCIYEWFAYRWKKNKIILHRNDEVWQKLAKANSVIYNGLRSNFNVSMKVTYVNWRW